MNSEIKDGCINRILNGVEEEEECKRMILLVLGIATNSTHIAQNSTSFSFNLDFPFDLFNHNK
jgi:hypothetical protein